MDPPSRWLRSEPKRLSDGFAEWLRVPQHLMRPLPAPKGHQQCGETRTHPRQPTNMLLEETVSMTPPPPRGDRRREGRLPSVPTRIGGLLPGVTASTQSLGPFQDSELGPQDVKHRTFFVAVETHRVVHRAKKSMGRRQSVVLPVRTSKSRLGGGSRRTHAHRSVGRTA